jgi:hypothetical protein
VSGDLVELAKRRELVLSFERPANQVFSQCDVVPSSSGTMLLGVIDLKGRQRAGFRICWCRYRSE